MVFSKFLGPLLGPLWGHLGTPINILRQKGNPTTIYCGREPMAGETRFSQSSIL